MAFIRDGLMAELDYLEENGLLSLNRGHYVGSGGFGYTNQLPGPDFDGKVRTMDMWGFAESQTVGISPDAFEGCIYIRASPFVSVWSKLLRLLRAAQSPVGHCEKNAQFAARLRFPVGGQSRYG